MSRRPAPGYNGLSLKDRAALGASSQAGLGWMDGGPTLSSLSICPVQLHKRRPLDRLDEPPSTEIVLGADTSSQPMQLSTPILLNGYSSLFFGAPDRKALGMGASLSGTALLVGEGPILPEEKELFNKISTKTVPQWDSGRIGMDANVLGSASAVEIRLGNGTSGGVESFIPASRLSESWAANIGHPRGIDYYKPGYHLDMERPADLLNHVELLREVTSHRAPVLVRLSPGDVAKDIKLALSARADGIILDVDPAGNGAVWENCERSVGIPVLPAVSSARVALDRARREGKGPDVPLLVNCDVRNGGDVFKLIALGANAVIIGTAAQIVMGCTECGKCHLGRCPVGLATHDTELQAVVDMETSGEFVGGLVDAMTDELSQAMAVAGREELADITLDDIRALTYDAAAVTGAPLAGLGRSLPMWEY